MVKRKPTWASMLPRGTQLSDFTLNELRNFKQVHAVLTERLPGPPAISYLVQSFRFLQMFATASIVEDKATPLQRASSELENLFGRDPAFEDGFFPWSWLLFDFPFGPQGQTALDLFEQFLQEGEAREHFRPFIAAARPSRLGLHQDIGRTKKAAKLRELFTKRTVSTFPSVEEHTRGEIFLTRLIHIDGQVFQFGNPYGFPADYKESLEDMILGKLFFFPGASIDEQYETFMKLAGPYWMSCVTQNAALPILPPDHYLTYLTP